MPNKLYLLAVFLLPAMAAVVVYQLDTFDAVSFPEHELISLRQPTLFVPKRNGRMLSGAERIGEGRLLAPEDMAYDHKSGVIYTGCADGWIRRVAVNDSAAVEEWVNTGGRPLGVVIGHNGEVIVADAEKGLLNISRDGTIELLSDEAEGVKFKLTDAVDIGHDGTVYFSDASYKYSLKEHDRDFYEGRPHGRLMSYHPSTRKTTVLVRDLYFANGVAVSSDQSFVIVCETPMKRCKRVYIQGPKKGSIDIFVENLPGLPDNIKYDGEGQYWIAFPSDADAWNLMQRYAFIRKVIVVMSRYVKQPRVEKNGGAIAVDLDGKPTAHYYDRNLFLSSSAIKIGHHLYIGSILLPYIVRLDVNQYPATAAA